MQGGPPTTPRRGSLRLLSTTPSQSSSMPLHSSGPGLSFCVQVRPLGPGPFMPVQVSSAVQWPCVITPLPEHGSPMPGTSSILPLQSLSTLSHTSVLRATPPLHTRPPFTQANTPVLHTIDPPEFMQSARFPDGQQA